MQTCIQKNIENMNMVTYIWYMYEKGLGEGRTGRTTNKGEHDINALVGTKMHAQGERGRKNRCVVVEKRGEGKKMGKGVVGTTEKARNYSRVGLFHSRLEHQGKRSWNTGSVPTGMGMGIGKLLQRENGVARPNFS